MNPNEKLPPGVARDDGTDRRTATDDILSEALAKRLSYDMAAAVAGVSNRTVVRRMKDPEFRAMVQHRRQDLASAITAQLTELTETALEALKPCLQTVDLNIRLKAIQLVLSNQLSFRQITDVAADVDQIKTMLETLETQR